MVFDVSTKQLTFPGFQHAANVINADFAEDLPDDEWGSARVWSVYTRRGAAPLSIADIERLNVPDHYSHPELRKTVQNVLSGDGTVLTYGGDPTQEHTQMYAQLCKPPKEKPSSRL